MSLAVGETHGNYVSRGFNNPEGVELGSGLSGLRRHSTAAKYGRFANRPYFSIPGFHPRLIILFPSEEAFWGLAAGINQRTIWVVIHIPEFAASCDCRRVILWRIATLPVRFSST
jgi:hypothetical protein